MSTTPELSHLTQKHLAGQHIVVWGAGTHGGGLAAAMHCHAAGARVSILDRRPPRELPEVMAQTGRRGMPWHLGEDRHPVIRSADLIVASPAIPPRALAALPPDAAPVVPAEALFLAEHRGPRLMVTGTKGKSTTAAACGTLLDWPVGGNSHQPLLDILHHYGASSPVVCELSSFQLWHLRKLAPSFSVGIMTTIHRDHLDWHDNEDQYRRAKLDAMAWAEAAIAPTKWHDQLPSGPQILPPVSIHNGNFRTADGTDLISTNQLQLPGVHNQENIALALTAAIHLGLDPTMTGIRVTQIQGLPHRLEPVHSSHQLTFVDDSIATTPEATIAGIAAIKGPLAVILGGASKGADFSGLATAIHDRGAKAVCIGQTGIDIAKHLQAHSLEAPYVQHLDAAITSAVDQLGEPGGTVLLSPACSSLDQFADFQARGNCFRDLAIKAWPATTPTDTVTAVLTPSV